MFQFLRCRSNVSAVDEVAQQYARERLERLMFVLDHSGEAIETHVLSKDVDWLEAALCHCKVVCMTLTFVSVANSIPDERRYVQILQNADELRKRIHQSAPPPTEADKAWIIKRFETLLVA